MKKTVAALLVIVFILVGVVTYLGFMPGFSPLFAKPVDLGVEADPALVAAFDEKFGMKNELPGAVVPADREPVYSGNVQLDTTLSSAEVTSILAYWRGQYSKMPIRDVQVRFNPDGTAEVSGILETKTAIEMARQLGYSDEEIEKGKKYVSFIAGDLPFYIKTTGGVSNNMVTLDPISLQIGRVTVPSDIVTSVKGVIEDTIERRIPQVGSSRIQSVSFQDGSVHFVGTVPDTIK